jgi:hypothetical protein
MVDRPRPWREAAVPRSASLGASDGPHDAQGYARGLGGLVGGGIAKITGVAGFRDGSVMRQDGEAQA